MLLPLAPAYTNARSFCATDTRAVVTASVSRPGAPRMRGFTPSCCCAARRACMPVYSLPTVVPITLADWSASMASASAPAPTGTRTTTTTGRAWSLMAISARASVPSVPALPMAASIFVNSTALFSGTATGSASGAVAISPMMDVEGTRRVCTPSLISVTRTPW